MTPSDHVPPFPSVILDPTIASSEACSNDTAAIYLNNVARSSGKGI